MGLIAYFDEIKTEIANLKISRRLNAAGNVSFRAVAERFIDPTEDLRFLTFDIYYGNRLLIKQGTVQSAVPVFEDGKTVRYIDFQATDELGLLTNVRAKSDAFFQNEKTLYALDYLLQFAPTDWKLGYTLGLDDTTLITKDLRDREVLFEQIKSIADATPLTYFRYGGFYDDCHHLDFGTLQDRSRVRFIQGVNLLKPVNKIPSSTKMLYEVEGYGGLVKEGINQLTFQDVDTFNNQDIYMDAISRELTLEDAYNYDNTLATDLLYPIIDKGDGTWVVRDNTNPVYARGATKTSRLTSIKPNVEFRLPATEDLYYFATIGGSINVDAIANEQAEYPGLILEAGLSLYKSIVNEIHKANFQNTLYEFEVIAVESFQEDYRPDLSDYLYDDSSEVLLDNIYEPFYDYIDTAVSKQNVGSIDFDQPYFELKVGQMAYIQSRVETLVWNYFTNTPTTLNLQNIADYETISDLDFEFGDDGILKISVKTGLDSYVELFDSDVILKEQSNKNSNVESTSQPTVSLGVSIVSDSITATNPDTSNSEGNDAKLFSLNMPSVPLGATSVRFSYYIDPIFAEVEVIQEPTLPASGFIAKVTLNDTWTNLNNATLYGVFIFT